MRDSYVGHRELSHQDLSVKCSCLNIYDLDGDGLVSADELFQQTLRMLMGRAMTDAQLGDIVDSTVMAHDHDANGRLSLQEFTAMLAASKADSEGRHCILDGSLRSPCLLLLVDAAAYRWWSLNGLSEIESKSKTHVHCVFKAESMRACAMLSTS